MKQPIRATLLVVSSLIVFAAFSRLLPWHNVTAIGAAGLFAAAWFDRRSLALAVPLIALYCSDILLNGIFYREYVQGWALFYPGLLWNYAAFAVVVLIGFITLRKVTAPRVVGSSLLASGTFFLISNFGVWAAGTMYPKTAAGLLTCYEMGLPFLRNTVLGDLLFCALLFGGLAWYRSTNAHQEAVAQHS